MSSRRACRILVLFLAAGLTLPGSAAATVYLPMSDARLADGAPLIVEGEILALAAAPPNRLPAVDYRLRVDAVLKGELAADELTVRIPGGARADGRVWRVWGAPRFAVGDRALLFLAPRDDGTFAIYQLMLGAFQLDDRDGKAIYRRDLEEADALAIDGEKAGPAGEGPRHRDGFVLWLTDRARGAQRPADYFVGRDGVTEEGVSESETAPPHGEKYAIFRSLTEPFPIGCGANGGHRMRWFDFDDGGSIPWRAHFSGQSGLSGGGFDQVDEAVAAWSTDPMSSVDLDFAGLTTRFTGMTAADGTNSVLFGDPNDEIAGRFDGAGVVAISGPWFSCTTEEYRGEPHHPIFEADIVTQDGIELLFALSSEPEVAAREIFAHEIGHTLGLAHSADREALMFARLRLDGRGSLVEVDDLAGIAELYGLGSPPVVIAPPTGFAAEATAGGIELSWDPDGNAASYRLDREAAGSPPRVMSANAAATSMVDTQIASETTYTYRLRSLTAAGASPPAVLEVTTAADPRPKAPSNLWVAPLSDDSVRLTWQDNSNDEDGYRVDIFSPTFSEGTFVEIPSPLPADTRTLILTGLSAETQYSFRIRAINVFGSSTASEPVTVSTFADAASCTVDSDRLCLLGGRFEVKVSYRNQHAGGVDGNGVAVPATDAAGMFWFFSPDNIELIVKVLDGTGLNGRYWVYYGGLSDVEFWLEVTDTVTGESRVYHNSAGELCDRSDTSAFPLEAGGATLPLTVSDPLPTAAPLRSATFDPAALDVVATDAGEAKNGTGGACEVDAHTLCLIDGRFAVSVDYVDQHAGGIEGSGRAVVGSDRSGFFWFFGSQNPELVVKVLDGGELNDHFWLFYGALTNLEYWIRVTDTETGAARTFYNPPDKVCGHREFRAFPKDPVEP